MHGCKLDTNDAEKLVIIQYILWTLSYSWNEGETWLTYKFLNASRMYVYGLLTEPGEQSAEFTIYGSYPGTHKWVVVQINLRKALGKNQSL